MQLSSIATHGKNIELVPADPTYVPEITLSTTGPMVKHVATLVLLC